MGCVQETDAQIVTIIFVGHLLTWGRWDVQLLQRWGGCSRSPPRPPGRPQNTGGRSSEAASGTALSCLDACDPPADGVRRVQLETLGCGARSRCRILEQGHLHAYRLCRQAGGSRRGSGASPRGLHDHKCQGDWPVEI